MKRHILSLLTLLSIMALTQAFAVQVSSIYQATIPVASQSEDLKLKAVQAALSQVLVKVSGNSQLLANPAIQSNLKNADQLVQEVSYSKSSSTPKTPYLLVARFDAENINRILRDAHTPIWGQNRPLILAWIEYEAPGKPAVIIDSDSISDTQTALKLHAEQRGLPIILPMMDMADINLVNVNDIVTMSFPVLEKAAKRYSSEAMLVARVFKLQAGYAIQSKMEMGDQHWEWEVKGKSVNEVVAGLLDHVSDTLAGRYASVVTDAVQSEVTLKVTNVSAETDLTQLMQYISHLTPVADVAPEQVAGSEVMLKVSLRGSKDALVKALSVGDKLQLANDSTDTLLNYEWNP